MQSKQFAGSETITFDEMSHGTKMHLDGSETHSDREPTAQAKVRAFRRCRNDAIDHAETSGPLQCSVHKNSIAGLKDVQMHPLARQERLQHEEVHFIADTAGARPCSRSVASGIFLFILVAFEGTFATDNTTFRAAFQRLLISGR